MVSTALASTEPWPAQAHGQYSHGQQSSSTPWKAAQGQSIECTASANLTAYATGFGDWVPAGPMGNKHLIGAFALLRDLQMGADFFGGSRAAGAAAQAARCSTGAGAQSVLTDPSSAVTGLAGRACQPRP